MINDLLLRLRSDRMLKFGLLTEDGSNGVDIVLKMKLEKLMVIFSVPFSRS